MPSLIKVAAENLRQEDAQDDKFYRQFLYYFELTVPSGAIEGLIEGSTKVFIFPLVLNPQGITMEEPFAVRATPTGQGGLFVEENGIVQRKLMIRGHTGFKPRKNFADSALADLLTTERPSFKRRGTWFPGELSGQRHFQFLQDRVFRIYADLKRDPTTSRETRLVFHNPKDDEHWLVAPQNFRMERDAQRPVFYNYTIELLVVDKADAGDQLDFSEDKNVFDQVKDVIRSVQTAIDNALGAINDVIAVINEIETIVKGVAEVVNSVSDFLNIAANFVQGVTDLISAPFNAVTNIVTNLETAINNLANATMTADDQILNSFRKMRDAVETFEVYPQIFQDNAQQQATRERLAGEISTSVSSARLAAAAANPPTRLVEIDSSGTAISPGDQARARGERGLGRNEPTFVSAERRIIEQSDTLPRLAARYMGDARFWRRIALLNGLQPPFITTQDVPNTLGPGDPILIPSPNPPPQSRPLTTIFGVSPLAPLEEQLLGSDLKLSPSIDLTARGFVDMQIDVAGGSIDFKKVTGIPNLSQAVVTRVTTEQGTNVLYRRLGYKRLVGLSIPSIDGPVAEFRLVEAVLADPRIADIKGVRIRSQNQPDIVDVEMDAAVRGFNEPVQVVATVEETL